MQSVVLVAEGATTFDSSLIADEVDMVESLYPQAEVHRHVDRLPSMSLCVPIMWTCACSSSRATLHLQLVYGYPFVLPNITMELHPLSSATARGIKRGGSGDGVVDVGIVVQEFLAKGIREAMQPAIAVGQPCLVQLIAHVEEFFNQPQPPAKQQHLDNPPTSASQSLLTSGGKTVAFSSPVSIEASVRAPVADEEALLAKKAASKQMRRLAALALHLTQKCCELYSKESEEEAEDNFAFLKRYLTEDVGIVPHEISERWDAAKMLRAGFANFVNSSDDDDVRLCLKWFWGTSSSQHARLEHHRHHHNGEAHSISMNHRFQHDFIQQRRIGAGGFAPVFVCRKIVDGRLYAIKKVVIRTDQSARALREVQTLAGLDHDNIVRYYDAWAEAGVAPDLEDFVKTLEEEEEEEEEEGEEQSDEESNDSETTSEDNETSSQSSHTSATLRLPPTSKSSARDGQRRSAAEAFFDSDDEGSGSDNEHANNSASAVSSMLSSPALGSSVSASTLAHPSQKLETKQSSRTPHATGSHILHGHASRYHTLYIQMELCQAKTLRHLLDSGRFADAATGEKMAASILRQLLLVVAHVHAEHVVHRDLKPDNVLFQHATSGKDSKAMPLAGRDEFNFGTIKVADFGLARSMPNSMFKSCSTDLDALDDEDAWAAATMPSSGDAHQMPSFGSPPPPQLVTTNCGTILYCAPEQANGATYDTRVDEYSVGMIALEMWLAVAGKDFRERYIIMNQVSRSQGALPKWFEQQHPKMAEIIASLICFDPRKRSTCDAILASSELPGEPAEVTMALQTLSQHGPRIIGRLFQRLEEHALHTFRRRGVPTAATRSLQQVPLEFQRHIELVAVLHGAVSLPFMDMLVPLAPTLKDLAPVGTVLMDDGGRCFIHAPFPQLPVAAFLAAHRGAVVEDCFSFYYTKMSRALFSFGTLLSPTSFDPMLQAMLFALHVLSGVESGDGSCVHITFFACSDRMCSPEGTPDEDEEEPSAPTTPCLGPEDRGAAVQAPRQRTRHEVRSAEQVERVLETNAQAFDVEDAERLQVLLCGLLHAMPHLFRSTAAMPRLFIGTDWALTDDAPVDCEHLSGIVVDVAHVPPGALGAGTGGSAVAMSTNATSIGVGCSLQPYTALFSPYHTVAAFMVTFDVAAMQGLIRRVTRSLMTSAVLDGVVVSRSQVDRDAGSSYAPAANLDCILIATKLWASGHRVLPRARVAQKELAAFKDASLSRQCGWWMTDGMKILSVHSVLGNKPQRYEVRPDALAADVRGIMVARLGHHHYSPPPGAAAGSTGVGGVGALLATTGSAGTSGAGTTTGTAIGLSAAASAVHSHHGPTGMGSNAAATSTTAIRVEFASREDSGAVMEARELFAHLLHAVPNSIVAALCTASEVRRCYSEFIDAYDRSMSPMGGPPDNSITSPGLTARCGVGAQAFLDWLKKNFATLPSCFIPVFCLVDRRMEILVHHQRLKHVVKGKAAEQTRGGRSQGHHSKKGGKQYN